MANIQEGISLIQRICQLPDNDEQLRVMGLSDCEIASMRDILAALDPDANATLIRMKEIIAKCDEYDRQRADARSKI